MNALNQAIKAAFEASGATVEANKAYLEFIKANFIVPIEDSEGETPVQVLFLEDGGQFFLPVFTEMAFLDAWASEVKTKIKVLKLSAIDLLKGVGEAVTVCLDIGTEAYKEFNPAELARMKSMVLKLFK